jgi:choline transporter-like protein 2/4/5
MVCLDAQNGTSPAYAQRTIRDLVQSSHCAPYIYTSKPIFGRCLPSEIRRLFSNGTGKIYDKSGKLIPFVDAQNQSISGVTVAKSRELVIKLTNVFEKIVSDLYASWPTILVCLAFALVLSLTWILLLRCFAAFMVWFTLVLFVVLFTAGTIFSFWRWHHIRTKGAEMPAEFSFGVSTYFQSATSWLVLAIILLVVLVVIVLIVIFLRKRIAIAIAIIREASKALSSMTSVLFWPLLPLTLELLVFAQVLFVAICLRSMRDPVGIQDGNQTFMLNESKAKTNIKEFFQLIPCNPLANNTAGKACRFLYHGGRAYTTFLQFVNLFMFFWLINFVRALAEMTLAGTFAHWYFSRHDPQSMPKCPLWHSFFRAAFYHIGSLAFGSLLIALLQWLRSILEWIDTKLKKYDNAFVRCCVRCCCCCMWCLEKFLKFLNRNAFIMIAIYGQNFCSAAHSAFYLLLRNAVRLVVVDKVTDFILLVGKLIVMALCGFACFLYLEGYIFAETFWSEYHPSVHYVIVPVTLVIIGSSLIAGLFASVYEMGVDTIFLCFLEDLERNDGSPEHPYYMNKELMQILGKKNQNPKSPKELELQET